MIQKAARRENLAVRGNARGSGLFGGLHFVAPEFEDRSNCARELFSRCQAGVTPRPQSLNLTPSIWTNHVI